MNKHLRAFLESEAARLAEPVKKFAEITAVYEGKSDEKRNEKCSQSLKNAIEAVMEWLEQVILMEAAEGGQTSGGVKLIYPGELILLSMYVNKERKASPVQGYRERFCDDELWDSFTGDAFMTPIGVLRMYEYQAVVGIKGNPAELFYRHLHTMNGILHDKCGSGVLNKELLKQHNMNDPLKIYQMDLLLRDIDKFFEG